MKETEKYIADERELELLKRYEGNIKQQNDPHRYDILDKDSLTALLILKDRSNDMFIRRYEGAKNVIDAICRKVGIDPDNTCYWLYALDYDGSSPILRVLEDWVSRSGEKAQLKRELKRLQDENNLLRDMLRNG